jgi:hypothetical protein
MYVRTILSAAPVGGRLAADAADARTNPRTTHAHTTPARRIRQKLFHGERGFNESAEHRLRLPSAPQVSEAPRHADQLTVSSQNGLIAGIRCARQESNTPAKQEFSRSEVGTGVGTP